MITQAALNLFYAEPDPDRWFNGDRYPRSAVRRLIRGKKRPGGVAMIAKNLMKGLERISVPYRFNDYRYAHRHPQEVVGIIGKPHLLFDQKWNNPIIFGAGVYSHPVECPDLFEKYPNVKRFIVPGKWMQAMCEPYYPHKVLSWPVGTDTDLWSPVFKDKRDTDILVYDKTHGKNESELTLPIKTVLAKHGLTYKIITYGHYTSQELLKELNHARAAIFLSAHETQGLAYQQILATGTPVLAWDKGGFWTDPYYYPEKIQYQPVTSVPYWDERCGLKFTSFADFEENLLLFWEKLNVFDPRSYIMENLTLEICAEKYVEIYRSVEQELSLRHAGY